MSATNRGLERQLDDHYVTPGWAVRALLNVLPPHLFQQGATLDAGCGRGNIAFECMAVSHTLIGVEQDKRRVKQCQKRMPGMDVIQGDFLDRRVQGVLRRREIGTILMNPPYSHALDFILAARAIAPTAIIAALTRLNWIAGARIREPARKVLLRQYPPVVCVLERRPSFGLNKHGKPGTDGTEYAWLVWGDHDDFSHDWCILDCESSRVIP